MSNIGKRFNFLRAFLASEIPLRLVFSKHVRFPHAVGIVISNAVVIGSNITIFSGVTIGGKEEGEYAGFPIIEDNVTIYTGACIVGKVRIGKGSVIGANATITRDVPPNSVAYTKGETVILARA